MRQADLDRAVARATGETVSTIKRLGFLIAEPNVYPDPDPDSDEYGPLVIDWDELAARRCEECMGRPRHEPSAA